MKRFTNIIAFYDSSLGSDDALGQAAHLAAANGARLTVVDVLPDGHGMQALVEDRRKRLKRLEPSLHAQGVDKVSSLVLVGAAFLEIVRTVIREEADLVILSAEGGSVLKSIFFGSTATHLIRKCPCPVWVIKPGQATPYKRVLAAIDPADHGGDDALNVKILEIAASLAAADGGDLHVVHGWTVPNRQRLMLASELPDHKRTEILENTEATHRNRVKALFRRANLSGASPRLHLSRDLPERAIVNAAEAEDIDIIVMGSVTRTGIAGLLMGNTAETVLGAVRRSVFAVKPEGFQSPVTIEDQQARFVA